MRVNLNHVAKNDNMENTNAKKWLLQNDAVLVFAPDFQVFWDHFRTGRRVCDILQGIVNQFENAFTASSPLSDIFHKAENFLRSLQHRILWRGWQRNIL